MEDCTQLYQLWKDVCYFYMLPNFPVFHGDLILKVLGAIMGLFAQTQTNYYFPFVLLSISSVFAAGCNKLGQCGLGGKEEITSFTKIPWSCETPVKQVA